MIKRTMLIFMLMSKKFLVMIKVIIILLYLFIMIHMLCLHRTLLMLIVEIGLGIIMLCLMHLGKHAIVLLLFIMHVMCWGEGKDATLRSRPPPQWMI
jgi:hypothetical protein